MKSNRCLWIVMVLMAAISFPSCTPEEEENPVVYIIRGPNEVFQTQIADYEVVVPYAQNGTTWSWTATGATVQSVSADTKTATISFPTVPQGNTATITVGETMANGVKAPDKNFLVDVLPFCSFNINNFIGPFDCDEAGYGVYSVNFTKHATLANTIVNDNFWDFAAPGSVLNYTLSGNFNEVVTVSRQTFTFGDDEVGWVEGNGTYSGCEHTMIVDYLVNYLGDVYEVHQELSPAKKGTINTVIRKKSAEYFK